MYVIKQHIRKRRNSAIAIVSLVIILLIAISTVFSPQIFTASAYAQSDLARAEKAESKARQEYESARTEADRLESIKQGFDTSGQDEILANAALEIKEKMESKLMAITDSAINDIAVIYANKGYTYTQKLNKTENILDKASSSISSLINDLKTDARTCYDEYIDVFLDDDVDYSYVWNTLYSQVAKDPGYVDFLLWDLFLDMKNGNSIETNRDIIHNAIAEEADNIENTITYEVPGWVAYCIDREIENGMGDLEEKWQSALQTLVEIRQELCEYDYSVLPEAVDYTQNTEKSVVFTINGDFDAVKKIEHFDMQEEPVWNDEYEAEVIFGEQIFPGEDYVLEKGENNTIIVRVDNDFLNKQSQGDHIFRLYYMTEDENEYVPFLVSTLPMGWTTEKTYDDGQDWEAEPVLVGSELEDDEYVSDADSEDKEKEKSFMSSISVFVWIIVLAAIFVLIAVVILIFVIICRKKKKKLLKDENKKVIIKEEKSAKNKIKAKTKHKAGKTLLMLLFVFSTLTFSFSGLTANAATSVSNIRYTIPGNPVTVKECPMNGDAVTVSGWGMTYDFDVLGWDSEDSDDPWGETTIIGSGVNVAKGDEGQATFTTTNNPTNGTRNAGTVTINSPGGSYSFTVRQTVITYDVIYNANGGIGAPANQTKKHLTNLKLSSVKPTREGYTFIGWSTSPVAIEADYKPGKTYKTDEYLALYAIWDPKTVTITWNANGGSRVPTWRKKTVGTKMGELPSTKRANCDFEGWYAGADETGKKISSTTTVPVRSTTYYAKWELRPRRVSLQTKFSVTPASLTFTHDTTKKSTVTVSGYEGNSSTINYWNKLSVSKPDWIKVSKDSKGKLSISVKENKKTQSRSGIIVLTLYNGGLCKINVTQKAMPVPVSSVSLDRSSASIDIGKTVTLNATVAPEDAANKRVTWTSSDTKTATVSSGGVVTGLKKGTVTITVKTSDGGKTAKCKVTVKPPSITVVPSCVTLHVGEKTKLSVEFTPSNGTDDSVTWSRPFAFFTAAEVDSDGTVTAIRPGKTVVTAKSKDGRKSTCTVEVVKKIEVTSVNVSSTSYTLFEGETVRLAYWVKPSNATDQSLKWSSSDPSIATVDSNGKIKGVKGGTSDAPKKATITATAQDGSGKKATCEITVLTPSKIWWATDKKTEIKDIPVGTKVTVKGKIQSIHKLKSVTVGIIAIGNSGESWSKSYSVDSNSFDLGKIDNEISFKTLPEGSYKFVVNATDIYGYEKSLQSTSFKVDKVVVYFGSDVDRDIVSSYSIGVIKDVMLASGVKYCTITSTIRTPEDQASAMYRNCKKTGVDYQLRLYGNAGDQVICVYRDNYEESSDKIKELMADKIRELWKKDIIVSKHCVSPESYAKRNVIDIGYASIVDQGKNQAFRSALSSNGSISKYIDEPNNSCHHIEIAQ